MIKEDCFDLDDRANKAPGGYNLMLEFKQLPFIFGHVMTSQDIMSLVFHEAGHAFHAFEMRGLPYVHQKRENMLPIEFSEVASTSPLEVLRSLSNRTADLLIILRTAVLFFVNIVGIF